MSKPFFTIIMATYNSAKNIRKALSTVKNQTFNDYEVVIVDGVSKDNTLEIIEEVKDERYRYISEKDNGLYEAFNKAMKMAKGEWLYFLGSDDWFYDDHVLNDIFNHLNNAKGNVYYGDVLIKGDTGWAKDGEIYSGKFSPRKLLKKNICHQSIFYRRSFIEENNIIYNQRFYVSSDWDFTIQCFLKAKLRYIKRTIAVFVAGGVSTGVIHDPFLKERKEIYKELYEKYKPTLIMKIKTKLKKYFSFF